MLRLFLTSRGFPFVPPPKCAAGTKEAMEVHTHHAAIEVDSSDNDDDTDSEVQVWGKAGSNYLFPSISSCTH